MLAFPLVTTQFFSSGLIIVGKSFRYALVLTIGRDLRRTEMLINPLNFDSYIIRTKISQDASGKKVARHHYQCLSFHYGLKTYL